MNDIEEKILSKMNEITEKQEKTSSSFNYKGKIKKKEKKNLVEIVNLSDFESSIHHMLYDMINNTVMKNKQMNIKECKCKNIDGYIVFEGVMDGTEKNYFIENLIIRINNIELVRVKPEKDQTLFCIPFDTILKSMLYQTDDEYISDIQEAKEKNMKLLEEIEFEKFKNKEKKIRYSHELNKIFIN